MKLVIKTNKKYGTWLKGCLIKEHPKVRNKIQLIKLRRNK